MPTHLTARECELQIILRWHTFRTMFYRTNLLLHSRRVAWIVEEINAHASRIFGQKYDARRTTLLALVHDDAEIIMGDVSAGDKSCMTPAQLRALKARELWAIDEIAHRYPQTLCGYNYRSLLLEGFQNKTLEAQVKQWADKFDGFGEQAHELFAGNAAFTAQVTDEHGEIPAPTEIYLTWFRLYPTKYPDMLPLLGLNTPLLRPFPELHPVAIAHAGKPHTPESFREPSGYWPYDAWKQITLGHATPGELRTTLTQAEFTTAAA